MNPKFICKLDSISLVIFNLEFDGQCNIKSVIWYWWRNVKCVVNMWSSAVGRVEPVQDMIQSSWCGGGAAYDLALFTGPTRRWWCSFLTSSRIYKTFHLVNGELLRCHRPPNDNQWSLKAAYVHWVTKAA